MKLFGSREIALSTIPPASDLADLRRKIDRIDEAMHRLLMERGEIIDRLIAIKRGQGPGSAFRPGREASMMRALAERHRGLLPLDTVEGIWRVIISTFTFVQAPFAVHADVSAGDAAMRDCARFHFGFTAPFRPHQGAAAVVEAVAASRGDLGLVRLDEGATSAETDPWWRALEGEGAPKIIARLPFIERAGHPAGTPVCIISHPLPDGAQGDVLVYAVRLGRALEDVSGAVDRFRGEVLARIDGPQGPALLLAAPESLTPADLAQALADAGAPPLDLIAVGSHPKRFRVSS